jgi:hypothetical protein
MTTGGAQRAARRLSREGGAMKRVLIVANETAGGAHLRAELERRMAAEPHSFMLVVPATHGSEDGLTWTEGQARKHAAERMEQALQSLRDVDPSITGEVGNERPMDAIADVMLREHFDEIIISTLPKLLSRWLKMDLPHRVEYRWALPVAHISAEAEEHHAA